MKNRPAHLSLALALALLLAGMSGPAPAASNQAPGDNHAPTFETPAPVDSQRTLMAVYYTSQEQLNELGAGYDVWHLERDKGFAAVYLRSDQQRLLESRGFRMLPLVEELGLSGASLDSQFFHYDSFVPNSRNRYVVNVFNTVTTRFPELTEVIDVGDAWETTHGGHDRDMTVVRITNEDPQFGAIEDKPAFVLMANIHAREVATPELVLRYALFLLNGYRGSGGYGVDADATWLIDHHVAYLIVMQNPDGHAVNEDDIGANRRKNLNDLNGCQSGALTGVDLNRNHSFLWNCCNGSSGDPCSDTYRGSSAGSEPETRAFEDWLVTVLEDQNGPNGDNQIPAAAPLDTSGLFISLHSYGDLVLWPWQFLGLGDAPNANQLETLGEKLAFYNGYDASGNIGYAVDGATDDWVYGKLGVASFTFEVGSSGFGSCGGFFPDYRCLDGFDGRDFWGENGPAFLWSHKVASAPYSVGFGPDALELAITGVELSGAIEDRRLSSSDERDVVAAEYFIGTLGEAGTGIPLSASDGNWNEVREPFTATLDDSGLAPGSYYVLVHGQAENGAWGPFSAAWLEVE